VVSWELSSQSSLEKSNELRPSPESTEGIVERLAGSLKTDAPSATDKEIDAILENRLKKKYL
jgi:hypothetical protein